MHICSGIAKLGAGLGFEFVLAPNYLLELFNRQPRSACVYHRRSAALRTTDGSAPRTAATTAQRASLMSKLQSPLSN